MYIVFIYWTCYGPEHSCNTVFLTLSNNQSISLHTLYRMRNLPAMNRKHIAFRVHRLKPPEDHWWTFFQKRIEHTKLDIYLSIKRSDSRNSQSAFIGAYIVKPIALVYQLYLSLYVLLLLFEIIKSLCSDAFEGNLFEFGLKIVLVSTDKISLIWFPWSKFVNSVLALCKVYPIVRHVIKNVSNLRYENFEETKTGNQMP